MREIYTPSALTGGTAGSLDAISVDVLNDGDVALVMTGTSFYVLEYHATSTEAEASPSRIRPDDYSTSGVWHLQTINDQSPVGLVVLAPFSTIPTGYLECDGAAISRSTYASLYAVISTIYGVGDGSTTFNLPDYRGRFLRGWAHGQTTDPDKAARTDRGDGTTGDSVGTKQADGFKAHTHIASASWTGTGPDVNFGVGEIISGINQVTSSTGGNETRPTNIYVMYCIKY